MTRIHRLTIAIVATVLAVSLVAGIPAYASASSVSAAPVGGSASVEGVMGEGIQVDQQAASLPASLSSASGLVSCIDCGGDHGEEDGATHPQALCPIMGLPVNKELHADVRGQRIYVCCPGCVAPVRNNPEAALATLGDRNEYAESLQTMCPVMNAPINKEMFVEYKGRRIYVCCPPCIETIQADPARYAAIIAGDDPDAADAPKDGGNAASPTEEATPPATDAAATSGNPDGSANTPARPQTRCPIMDAPVTPGTSAHVDVKGYRIYICCPPCRAKVEADPDASLAAIRARGEEPEPLPLAGGE